MSARRMWMVWAMVLAVSGGCDRSSVTPADAGPKLDASGGGGGAADMDAADTGAGGMGGAADMGAGGVGGAADMGAGGVGGAAVPELRAGDGTAPPGGIARLPVALDPSVRAVTALQFTLEAGPDLTFGAVQPGADAAALNKQVASNRLPDGRLRVILFGLDVAPLSDVDGDGQVSLAHVEITVAPAVAPGPYAVTLGEVVASDATGQQVPLTPGAGALQVAAP